MADEQNGVVTGTTGVQSTNTAEAPMDIYGGNAVLSDDSVELISNGTTLQVGGLPKTSQGVTTEEQPKGNDGEETPKEEDNKPPEEKQEEPEKDPNADPVIEATKAQLETAPTIEKELTDKGVDFKAIEQTVLDAGEPSAEQYEALEKAGYPKNMVDAYLRGLKADAEAYQSKVLGIAGGQKEYQELTAAIAAKGPKYVEAYNKAVNAGDITVVEVMLNDAKTSLIDKRGVVPAKNVLGNVSTGPKNTQPFANQAEMIAAINDPKYRKDAAYRAQVEARMQKTIG